jgi:multidrug efflux pump subunit AcrA (membrane-fusion protein)
MANKTSHSRLQSLRSKSSTTFSSVRERFSYGKTTSFIQRRPFISFFVALTLMFALIVLGSTVFAPKPVEEKTADAPKQVETFKIGSAPRVSVQGQVEKSGVIKIVAQAPGIVSGINVYEGQEVVKGGQLLSLSSNYQGGNAAAVQAQIAKNSYNLAKDTNETQKDLINKQREIANKTDANADELRDISARSIDETRGLLDLNQSLLDQLNIAITNAPDQKTKAELEGQKAQLQSGLNQLRAGLRQTEYAVSGDKPQAQLSDIGREIALKQLEIQEKSLASGLETARLSSILAGISASAMYPATPVTGIVQRIHVRVGEAVNPGTTLATISGAVSNITIVANVPANIAQNLSKTEESEIIVNGKPIMLMPSYVTTEAISGQQYGVIYQVGDGYTNLFTDDAFVEVRIPVGSGDTNSFVPMVPVDAVFQTQDAAYMYVKEGDIAHSRTVKLGNVQGGFVAIIEGLNGQEEIIASRNVVDGDKVVEVAE